MLESRPEDALVKLVKTVDVVETVETVETVKLKDCIDWRSEKSMSHSLTYSVCDNLKARDASASKKWDSWIRMRMNLALLYLAILIIPVAVAVLNVI